MPNITTFPEYRLKWRNWSATEAISSASGGLHPKLGLEFYVNLFTQLKSAFPNIRLHALGPPEIAHLAKLDGLSNSEVCKTSGIGVDSRLVQE